MIGLDTNVLVRYFARDDDSRAARANEFIAQLSESSPGYVTTIALVETYWVPARAYKLDDELLADIVRGLLDAKEIVVEHADIVRKALRRQADGADFAGSLISESGADAGCVTTVTFDRRAAKLAGMQLLE